MYVCTYIYICICVYSLFRTKKSLNKKKSNVTRRDLDFYKNQNHTYKRDSSCTKINEKRLVNGSHRKGTK